MTKVGSYRPGKLFHGGARLQPRQLRQRIIIRSLSQEATRFDRKLLGKLCACVWTCLKDEIRLQLGRDDVVPGMIAAIQTHGELLHWHPHIHTLLTCGAFAAEGEFLEVPELDLDRLLPLDLPVSPDHP